jgi:hypothetical protein
MARDISELFELLNQGRYRAIIIYVNPGDSLKLSEFAENICSKHDGEYLDLLELFIKSKTLHENVDRFSPDDFRSLIIEHNKNTNLLVVDRIDFILDTWRRLQRKDFYTFIDNQWDCYKDSMDATLVICLEKRAEFEGLNIVDFQGSSRVFQLTDFNAIF